MALPGWYSPSIVVEIHATLEAIAVLFFVALVVFDVWAHIDEVHKHCLERIGLICFAVAVLGEVCAYPYSRRIDTLSSAANARLNKEAAEAREAAGNANERAGKNEKVAQRLQRQNLATQKELSEEQRRRALLDLKTAQLKRANLELESALSPRLFHDQNLAAARLAVFSGISVKLKYFTDFEVRRTAEQIAFVFSAAHWQFTTERNSGDDPKKFILDGVTVYTTVPGGPDGTYGNMARDWKTAGALVEELNKGGISARQGPVRRAVAPGTLWVEVGMKPNPAAQRMMNSPEPPGWHISGAMLGLP